MGARVKAGSAPPMRVANMGLISEKVQKWFQLLLLPIAEPIDTVLNPRYLYLNQQFTRNRFWRARAPGLLCGEAMAAEIQFGAIGIRSVIRSVQRRGPWLVRV